MKSKVVNLTLETFPQEINVPSVFLLSREDCHYCKNLKPIYERISLMKEYDGVYNFYVIDADEQPFLYERFQSDGVPTMYVFYDDEGIEIPYPKNPTKSGYSEKDITSFLNELME